MKIKFDKQMFKDWYDLNNMSRNKVIKSLGQKDPNKVSRWLSGQVIAIEDIISLCNHYDFEIGDFLIVTDEEQPHIKTAMPDNIKERRKNKSDILTLGITNTPKLSDLTTADDITIARLSLQYEKKINALILAHSQELKEERAGTRQQVESRNELIKSLQATINVLNDNINRHGQEEEKLTATILALKETINQQHATIASYDSIIRKQKKLPPQTSPFLSGQVTMVNDGGGAVSAASPQKNE